MLSRSLFVRRGVTSMAGSGKDLAASVTELLHQSPKELLQQQKKALRSVVKRGLRNFPLHLRQEEDVAIQNHVLSADWFKQSDRLCAYLSCASLREVDTTKIVADILQPSNSGKAKELYVPRVVDRQANMSMLQVFTTADLILNSMGIVEPDFTDSSGNPRKNVMEADKPVDLLLLPGLAFDGAGRRCGRGGGYYDVFLMKYLELVKDKGWKQPLLVALAYSVQVLEEPVPVDETDIPVDALVLSTGVLPISDHALMRLSTS